LPPNDLEKVILINIFNTLHLPHLNFQEYYCCEPPKSNLVRATRGPVDMGLDLNLTVTDVCKAVLYALTCNPLNKSPAAQIYAILASGVLFTEEFDSNVSPELRLRIEEAYNDHLLAERHGFPGDPFAYEINVIGNLISSGSTNQELFKLMATETALKAGAVDK